jgi:hypothetical protein
MTKNLPGLVFLPQVLAISSETIGGSINCGCSQAVYVVFLADAGTFLCTAFACSVAHVSFFRGEQLPRDHYDLPVTGLSPSWTPLGYTGFLWTSQCAVQPLPPITGHG